MKNIYLITRTDDCDYYEYDSIVIVATTQKKAIEYATTNNYYGININNIICKLIGEAKSRQPFGKVIASFNAG